MKKDNTYELFSILRDDFPHVFKDVVISVSRKRFDKSIIIESLLKELSEYDVHSGLMYIFEISLETFLEDVDWDEFEKLIIKEHEEYIKPKILSPRRFKK